MPELPEVESVVRSLRPLVVGRRIISTDFPPALPRELFRQRMRRIMGNPIEQFRRRLSGVLIRGIERHGKYIVFDLERDAQRHRRDFLVVHLGMTGQLTCEDTPQFQSEHTHVVFSLSEPGRWLHYTDIRRFGRLRVTDRLLLNEGKLGPEPLEITQEEFAARLRSRRTMM